MVIVILFVLGLCLGSFVNALVWRLHEQEELKEKQPKNITKRLAELSITKGRSMCPGCSHQLRAKDLVPVLSWLSLGGKCRYCKKPISIQYPAVELITGGLFMLSFVAWPYALTEPYSIAAFAVWLGVLVGFVAHCIYDIRWYTLLDRVTLPLTALGIVYVAVQAYGGYSLTGPVVGAAALFGLFFILFQVSDGRWIGGGDVKLAPLLGLLAGGLMDIMLLLFVASSLGTLYAVSVAVARKKPLHLATRIPFGPFLITATIFVVLFGQGILDWYTSLLIST